MNTRPTAFTENARALTVTWSDGCESSFLYLWLRDNCPQLRHASTKHRVAETSEIPDDVHPSNTRLDADGNVILTWAYDQHVSTFPAAWLRAHDYANGARHQAPVPKLWDATIGDALPTASYPDIVNSLTDRASFLRGFVDHGVAVLRNVPSVPGTVLDVGRLFGELRSTSWGLVFDVISMEDANSVAYTNLPLVTHTDEGYRDPAPTVQLQHFIQADAQGGESTLVDGFRLADELRVQAPHHFDALSNTLLHFHIADATTEHWAMDSVISLRPDGSVKGIRYSNHSVLPFLLPPEHMEAFYSAYRAFGRMRESVDYQLRLKMGAGDLYMVDNHRVLHGRTGFSTGGARHLQSCYIERDELISRLTVLERSLAAEGPLR